MKQLTLIAVIAALIVAGCGSSDKAAEGTTGSTTGTTTTAVKAVGYDVGSKKVGDKATCAVCTIKEGKVSAEEEVKAVVDYEGKTYCFCDDAEKAEFISDPKKYVSN